jgi:hypothetical protein
MRSNRRPDTLMQDRIRQIDENLLRRTAGPYIGSIASFRARSHLDRFTPMNGRAGP